MLDYKVEWLVENRVLHAVVSGDYDRELVQQGLMNMKAKIDSGTAPVHIVLDVTGIHKLPKNMRELIDQMGIMRNHANIGWVVSISNNVMLRFAGQLATVFIGAKMRPVASYDEAVETICHIDPTVEDGLRQTLSNHTA